MELDTLKYQNQDYFWSWQNSTFFKDTVKINVRNSSIALEQDIITVSIT